MVVQRIVANRRMYEERNKKKEQKELAIFEAIQRTKEDSGKVGEMNAAS